MLYRRSTSFCYGNNKRYQLQLNYLSQFLRKYNTTSKKCKNNDNKVDKPTFSLNWLSEISHDWINQVAVADNDLVNFFTKMENDLKDSFVFVFGDHGSRFGQIRETVVGRIEEQMPFFSMHIPNWLSEKYPQLLHIIEKNSNVCFVYFFD